MSTVGGLRIGRLEPAELKRRLRGDGLGIRIGPFDVHVRTDAPGIPEALHLLYDRYECLEGERVYSCRVQLHRHRKLWLRPGRLVRFSVDGRRPHEDLPEGQALAALEWGINLVLAMRAHAFLLLHAAALERGGRALLLPAAPGHGKTTLAVALAHRGWRLFSDEFGLLRPGGSQLIPAPRPMPLKNESISVIREFAPDAVFGPTIPETRKGTIAHVRPPADSVDRVHETAAVRWIVFPRWQSGAALRLSPMTRELGLITLAGNAFNYELLGDDGFATLCRVLDSARCFSLVYSDLEQAIGALTSLADSDDG